jgi:phage portal protein BeeE
MPIVQLPTGYELKPIGFDPAKGQMTEARRFQVEQIARIYNMPPVFLQDLTNGTFSNSEQQDLFFVKHLVANGRRRLKRNATSSCSASGTAGATSSTIWMAFCGATTQPHDGPRQAIQNAIRTPNEVRALENLPALPNGDELMIQGATVPLGTQPIEPGTPPPADGGTNDDGA